MAATVTITTVQVLAVSSLVSHIGEMIVFALIILLIAKEYLTAKPEWGKLLHSQDFRFLGSIFDVGIIPFMYVFVYIIIFKAMLILR